MLKWMVLLGVLVVGLRSIAQETRIVVDADKVMNPIGDHLYGSCIEDVNHEIYGGLYDQRLYGESFEEPAGPEGVSGMWDAYRDGGPKSASFAPDSLHPFNGSKAQLIEQAGAGIAGIINRGLNRWGIGVRKGQLFSGSVWLRGEALGGPVVVELQSGDGKKVYASQALAGITGEWKKYSFALKSGETDPVARFVLYIRDKGRLWVDQALLTGTGKDRFKGLPVRADIAVKMQEEGLNFVRYGGSMVNAPGYRWKNMIGDRDRRPVYKGTWYPWSSNGWGIEDFLQFTEAAGFESAFAINIEETDQDAADLAEYLKGDASTPWGRKRAENGHPAPYKVKYIEIGNEEVIESDSAAGYRHYIERFNGIWKAMHEHYPELVFVNAAWWRSQSANMETVFRALNGKSAFWDLHVESDAAESGTLVDQRLARMQERFRQWDPQSTMRCVIFEENGGLHNLQRALGHATTLNAVRRHGDFVMTSCAANGLQALGQNDNGWDQGQIFFTPSVVYGMPPFYAQQMAAGNHEPLRIADSVENNPAGPDGVGGLLDVTATKSADGKTLVVHVVNTGTFSLKTTIAIKGFPDRHEQVRVWMLAGGEGAIENTPEDPERVVTKRGVIDMPANGNGAFVFPARSYTVVRFLR